MADNICPYSDAELELIPEMLQTPTVINYEDIIMRLYTSYSKESDNSKILQGIKWMSSKKKLKFNEKYADLISDYNTARLRVFKKCGKSADIIIFNSARINEISDITYDKGTIKNIMKLINKHDMGKVILNFISIYIEHELKGVDDAFGKVIQNDFDGL